MSIGFSKEKELKKAYYLAQEKERMSITKAKVKKERLCLKCDKKFMSPSLDIRFCTSCRYYLEKNGNDDHALFL